VQELWELFQLEDDSPEYQVTSPDASEELLLAISKAVVNGITASRTVKFSAGGGSLTCDYVLPQAIWFIGALAF